MEEESSIVKKLNERFDKIEKRLADQDKLNQSLINYFKEEMRSFGKCQQAQLSIVKKVGDTVGENVAKMVEKIEEQRGLAGESVKEVDTPSTSADDSSSVGPIRNHTHPTYGKCCFCRQKTHKSEDCRTYKTPNERYECAIKFNRCLTCCGHSKNTPCFSDGIPCEKCGKQGHSRVFCNV